MHPNARKKVATPKPGSEEEAALHREQSEALVRQAYQEGEHACAEGMGAAPRLGIAGTSLQPTALSWRNQEPACSANDWWQLCSVNTGYTPEQCKTAPPIPAAVQSASSCPPSCLEGSLARQGRSMQAAASQGTSGSAARMRQPRVSKLACPLQGSKAGLLSTKRYPTYVDCGCMPE